MNTALLSGADTDGLSILDVAHRVGLRVLQRDERDFQVAACLFGELLVVCRNIVKEVISVEVNFVTSLFKGHAEHLLAFRGSGAVLRVHLQDDVSAFSFGTENFQCFRRVARSDDTVAHFAFDEQGCCFVANVGERDKIAVGRHTVRTTRTGIGRGYGRKGDLHIIHEIDFAQRIAQG